MAHNTAALGRRGEDLAAAHYVNRGYVLLDRNARYDTGELDLVFRSPEGVIVFVEVKTRSGRGFGGAEAVTTAKFARMRRAAARWLAGRRSRVPCRFDVVAIHRSGAGWEIEVFEGVDSGAR